MKASLQWRPNRAVQSLWRPSRNQQRPSHPVQPGRLRWRIRYECDDKSAPRSEQKSVRTQVIALAAANAAAVVAAGLAYFVYSKLLTPEQFALLAGAMTLAKFGNVVLDSGIKTAIVKCRDEIGPCVQRALFRGSLATALGITAVLGLVMLALGAFSRLPSGSAWFLSAYASAYMLTYPFLFLPLADLERNQRFGPVATWESISIGIEYLLPVPLWFLFSHSFTAFVAAVWLARVIRALGMGVAHGGTDHLRAPVSDWRGASAIFHEGWKYQLGSVISMVRDNLHYLLVAPGFGRVWAGLYAWAMQLANVSSQVFVQTASRVALPVLRLEQTGGSQWASTLVQMRWLAIFTLPLAAFLYHFAAIADDLFFSRRWAQALILVVALSLRMVPAIATTALGYLVLAQSGSGRYARLSLWWTLCELVAALAALSAIGVKGLACSYAVTAWVGVVICARMVPGGNIREVLGNILLRPSLIISALASTGLYFIQDWFGLVQRLMICATLIAAAIISETEVRALAQSLLRTPGLLTRYRRA